MNPIYKPSGRAAEYCEYAINPFLNCTHGCVYCYAPRILHKTREQFHAPGEPRKGLLAALEKQLSIGDFGGKLIQLGFLCDPYPCDMDTSVTREIIKRIKAAGAHVQILTKGGAVAQRDFDLLDDKDWFGITISGAEDKEPKAAPNTERLDNLLEAWNKGIKNWISLEPVFDAQLVYKLIARCWRVDELKIGKLNYAPSDIDWSVFGYECERLCKEYGRNYYIKEDLRKAMEVQP